MKSILKRGLVISVVLVATFVMYSLVNFPMWPRSAIKTKLLSVTPLGSSINQVLTYIDGKKWRIVDENKIHGFVDQRKNTYPDEYACNLGTGKLVKKNGYKDCIVGEKYIGIHLGDYRAIFIVSVTVFWAFDENDKLIDIWVWKTVDAL